MALSLQYWANYSSGKVKMQRKSENSVCSDHVLRFVYDEEHQVVSATVQASMRDKSYKVEICLNDSYGVTSSSCECPLKNYECHHVAAALLFGFTRASKTDVRCSWLKRPKSAPPKKVVTMGELFSPRKENYRALSRPVDDDDRLFMYRELGKLGRFTAMHWILSPEPNDELLPVAVVEDLLVSEQYLQAETRTAWLRKSLLVTPSLIERVQAMTVGQRSSPHWSTVRRLRLTASNFGPVLGAIGRKSFPPSLKKRLMSAYNLSGVQAVVWGITHEPEAIKFYQDQGAIVQDTGIFLHESGVLGASPDGKVLRGPQCPVHLQSPAAASLQPELLEVKCPYSARDTTLTQAVSSIKGFYLELKDGSLCLKENHDYWHQVQGQLHITGRRCCDLVVWTPNDAQVIRISKDNKWAENLSKLIDFYFTMFVPSFD